MLNKYNLNVAKFASKKESRYTLQAILVRPDATVATNGHYLVWVSTPKEPRADQFPTIEGVNVAIDDYAPFLLDAETALQIAKAIPKKSTIPILENVAVSATTDEAAPWAFTVTDLERPQTWRPRKPSGNFPPYENVIPTKEPVFRIALSASYLAQIAKAAAEFNGNGEKRDPVYLTFYSDKEPVRFDVKRSESGQGMTALLIPMRMEADVPHTYGWAERQAQRDVEAKAAQKDAPSLPSDEHVECTYGVRGTMEVAEESQAAGAGGRTPTNDRQ